MSKPRGKSKNRNSEAERLRKIKDALDKRRPKTDVKEMKP